MPPRDLQGLSNSQGCQLALGGGGRIGVQFFSTKVIICIDIHVMNEYELNFKSGSSGNGHI